jgi:hypothetical protein
MKKENFKSYTEEFHWVSDHDRNNFAQYAIFKIVNQQYTLHILCTATLAPRS